MIRQESVLHPDWCASVLGATLDQLLAPIAPDRPAGESLRGKTVYRALQEARREDDPTLPQGPWEHDLKRADWEKVAAVAADTLAHRSKDLQLAAWLAEAQVHRAGFLGLAAALTLMQELCENYWESIYPVAEEGDLEHRLNIFRWVNEKLLPALRVVPLTASGRAGGEYAWADWEQARRNEQLISSQGSQVQQQLEGATAQQFGAALAASPAPFLVATAQSIAEAQRSVERLQDSIDRICGSEAPTFSALHDLLGDTGLLVRAELRRRGIVDQVEIKACVELPDPLVAEGRVENAAREQPVGTGGIRDRAEAYALLEQAATFLMQVEPHSPAPYLVKRAIEWGQLNTAELYELLFIRHQGQLSIFDLLGIAPPNADQ